MNLFRQLIFIRVKQGERYLKELGVVRLIILGILVLLGYYSLWTKAYTTSVAHFIAGATLFTIATLHTQRSDVRFLQSILYQKAVHYMALEYGIIMLLPVIILLGNQQWIPASYGLPLSLLIAFIPQRKASFSFKAIPLPFISAKAFEWKSGIRKIFIFIAAIYAVTLSLTFSPFIFPVALFLIGILACSFYNEGESITMLDVFGDTPSSFLLEKMRVGFVELAKITFPIVILSLVFHPTWYGLTLYALLAISLLLLLAILTKYAFYQPKEILSLNSAFVAMMTVCFVVPFLAPVPIVMSIIQWRKAQKKLNQFI